MAGSFKWLGGVLGWSTMGPIGALLGFVFGSVADSLAGDFVSDKKKKHQRGNTHDGDFSASLLILSAAIMKADGRLLKSELNFIRDYFTKSYGAQSSAEHMKALKRLLDQDISVVDVCRQIRYYMNYSNKLHLMQYLFGIAYADGKISDPEYRLLRIIAEQMGIKLRDFESLKAIFGLGGKSGYQNRRPQRTQISDPYKVLGITKSATDSEVKKAFRAMARKYHPDKVSNLGEKAVKVAQEKFVKVDEAYDRIKEARGMK